MRKVQQWLSGKKTYFLAALGFAWAVIGWAMGYIDSQYAMEVAWASVTAAALRAGVAKR